VDRFQSDSAIFSRVPASLKPGAGSALIFSAADTVPFIRSVVESQPVEAQATYRRHRHRAKPCVTPTS